MRPVIALGAIGVASMSYAFVERPFLRLKKDERPLPTAVEDAT
jgi:peptidoglycan/LPS O-acetylase OafA/YrhL